MNTYKLNNPNTTAPLVIDLQLFSEGEVDSGIDGVSSQSAGSSSNTSTTQAGDASQPSNSSNNSNIDIFSAALKIFEGDGQGVSTGKQVTQTSQTTQTSTQDPAKDNLDNQQSNDTIPSTSSNNQNNLPWYQAKGFKSEEEALKSFDHLRTEYTKTTQELAQLKKSSKNNQQINNQQSQSQMQAQQTQQQSQQSQELEFNPEDFEEEFYNDMAGTITKLIESVVSKRLNPVVEKVNPVIEKMEYAEEKQAMNNLVGDFYSAHGDMLEYKEDMLSFLNQYPELPKNANTLETAYNYAKGLKANNINPSQLLNDPNAILQNLTNNQALLNQVISNPNIIQAILKNEGSRNAIIGSHMMDIKKNNDNIPTVIGNHNGSMTTITPPRKPTSWEDASKMAIEIFNMNG